MAYKITGNLADDARILVLSETNMSVEYNEATSAGEFEATDLTNNNKIILARKADGETFGYSGVTPVEYQSGPVIPTGDDFSTGINDWTMYISDADASMDWYENDSLRLSTNAGSTSESDWVHAVWKYGLEGDFDIEVEYKRLTIGSTSSPRQVDYGLYVIPSDDANGRENSIRIVQKEPSTDMISWYQLNNSVQENVINSTAPDPTSDNLKLRITKSGAVFTTYHDNGNGSWVQAAQFTAAPFENVKMFPMLHMYRYYSTYVTTKFTNFKVNSGTVVEPTIDTLFDDDTIGTTYQTTDTFGDWEVTQKAETDTIEVTSTGLRLANSNSDGVIFILNDNILNGSEDFTIKFEMTKNYVSSITEGGWLGLLLDNNIVSTDERIAVVYTPTPTAGMRVFKYVNGSQINSIATGFGDDGTVIIQYDASAQTVAVYHNGRSVTNLSINFNGQPVHQRLYSNNWANDPAFDFTFNNYKVWGTLVS